MNTVEFMNKPGLSAQQVRAWLGQEPNEILSPPGLSRVPRSLTRQKDPAFFQVLGSKLPTALNIPGAGHIPLPDPAQRGYCLVLTGTAAQRSGSQDTSLKGFLLCFHGFTFSYLCHPRCQDIHVRAQSALLFLFQEPGKWGERGRWLRHPGERPGPLCRAITD